MDPCMQILSLDNAIRFAGRIKDRKIISFARRPNAMPLLNEELSNMAHYQASLKASWEDMFNDAWENKLDDNIKRKSQVDNRLLR